MATKLKQRTVVIVGGGLTAGLVSRQLTAQGIDVLVLERGGNPAGSAAEKLPNQRDELRWDVRQGLIQDWAVQTYSLRHTRRDESLPVRRMEAFLPGEGLGGAANHWNGITWRWAEYDPVLRSRLESRYGKTAVAANMPIQDWGVTYAEMEPYHHLFEKLFGISARRETSRDRSSRAAIRSRRPGGTSTRRRRWRSPRRGLFSSRRRRNSATSRFRCPREIPRGPTPTRTG